MSVYEIAGLITAVAGALTVLWQYVFSPLRRVLENLKTNSELIGVGLPLLEKWLLQWPGLSGPHSFFDCFAEIEERTQINLIRHYSMLDLSATPMFECSPEGNCTFANHALCDLFGLSPQAMLGKGWLVGVEPYERIRVWELWQKAIEKQIPYEATYSIRNPLSGKTHKVTNRAVPLLIGNKLIGFYGIFKVEETLNTTLDAVHVMSAVWEDDKKERVALQLSCGHKASTAWTTSFKEHLKKNGSVICPFCAK